MEYTKFGPTPITYDGVFYETLAAACRANNVESVLVRTYKSNHKCTTEQALRAIIARNERGEQRVRRARKRKPPPLISFADVDAFDSENVLPIKNPFASADGEPHISRVTSAKREPVKVAHKIEDDEIRITITIKIPESLKKFMSVA